MFEAVAWLTLGGLTLVAAIRSRRSDRARLVGRGALSALFVLAGASVNAIYLATGTDYAAFADASPIPFVRETWRSVVGPDQWFWIGALVLFEAIVGLLVLRGGRATQAALVAMMGFHVALLSFGWFFWAWSLPMLWSLGLLLAAERAAARGDSAGTAGRVAVAAPEPSPLERSGAEPVPSPPWETPGTHR